MNPRRRHKKQSYKQWQFAVWGLILLALVLFVMRSFSGGNRSGIAQRLDQSSANENDGTESMLHQSIQQVRERDPSRTSLRTIRFYAKGLTVQLPTDYKATSIRPALGSGLISTSHFFSYGSQREDNQLLLGYGSSQFYGPGKSPLEEILNNASANELLTESDVAILSVNRDIKGSWNGFAFRDIQITGQKNLFARVRLILIQDVLYLFEATWTTETSAKAAAYFESIAYDRTADDFQEPQVTSAPLDLLALIDVKRDAVKGEWIRYENAIVTPPELALSMLVFPVDLPSAYELTLSLQRSYGTESFNIGVPIGESMAMIVIDGFGGTLSGLGVVAGQILQGRSDAVAGTFLSENQSEIVVKVKPRSIEVTLDGTPLVNWSGDPAELSIRRNLWPYFPGRIFVGSWESEFVIRAATIRQL